jgi:Methyltransferase domain
VTPLKEYVESISFRYFEPDHDVHALDYPGEGRWMDLCEMCLDQSPVDLMRRIKKHARFELDNTVLPDGDTTLKRLRPLLEMPRMSTLAMGASINRAVALSPPDSCYLNIGVWHGFTFLCGLAGNPEKRAVGVDNFSEYAAPRQQFLRRLERFGSSKDDFYDMDFERYLERVHTGPIGVFMYDGGCTYERQLRALELAERHFTDDCVVLLDDANADDTRRASMDVMAQGQHEYEVICDVRTSHDQHPTFWNGLLVYQRVA